MSDDHNEDECNCLTCFIEKRIKFENGEAVRIEGGKVVGFIDIAIVETERGSRVHVGMRDTETVAHILMTISTLSRYAVSRIGMEVPLNDKDKN